MLNRCNLVLYAINLIFRFCCFGYHFILYKQNTRKFSLNLLPFKKRSKNTGHDGNG